MGLSGADIAETVGLLRERGLMENEAEVLDGPFAHKPQLQPVQTRFSDGTIRVFYSALEVATAERESAYWYMKPLLQGEQPVRLFYRYFRCSFNGDVKDLRPLVGEHPYLIADTGYAACNAIGAEAFAAGLGGLLSRSARRPEGTTSSVFRRQCLSDVQFQGWRVFTYDPETQITTISSP
jgi:hypothetical protein